MNESKCLVASREFPRILFAPELSIACSGKPLAGYFSNGPGSFIDTTTDTSNLESTTIRNPSFIETGAKSARIL